MCPMHCFHRVHLTTMSWCSSSEVGVSLVRCCIAQLQAQRGAPEATVELLICRLDSRGFTEERKALPDITEVIRGASAGAAQQVCMYSLNNQRVHCTCWCEHLCAAWFPAGISCKLHNESAEVCCRLTFQTSHLVYASRVRACLAPPGIPGMCVMARACFRTCLWRSSCAS